MSNSVVKVTEAPINDSLILVIREDGTVTPDKETAEAYLNSRSGETELQIMQVNRSDGKNVDVVVDTLTYLASHEEGSYNNNNKDEELNEVERNLNSFRMDHDYTPLTSPRRPDHSENQSEVVPAIDDVAQTLSMLEGSNSVQPTQVQPITPVKIVKVTGIKTTPKKVITLNTHVANKNKFKQATPQNSTAAATATTFKQPNKITIIKAKPIIKPKLTTVEDDQEQEHFSDEDFIMESDESADDANDLDFDIDEVLKNKPPKKINRGRTRILQDQQPMDSSKPIKTVKIIKTIPPKTAVFLKGEPTPLKVEKSPETITEVKTVTAPTERKPVPKKEKKMPKPLPDDFALFSTPDIIRRVGGKQDGVTTPTTPNPPESPKSTKQPAKIFATTKPDNERSSIDSKEKRLSIDGRSNDSAIKQSVHRLSLGSENKNKEKRLSVDAKIRRQSADIKINSDKVDIKRFQLHNHNAVQNVDETAGGSSNESLVNNHLESIPSTAEDIRAIIQNEDTKSFTSNLVIPEPSEQASEENIDQSQINLETGGLDLDQSILDNINTDLIPDDLLYQVAQSLVDNPELQNAIDKSLVDGNLVLDTSMQQHISNDDSLTMQQNSPHQVSESISPATLKGTQVVRSDGRVVVIPPIERPTTRSRNKKVQEEIIKQTKANRIFEEHVSGAELDSSSDDDKSDDDPDKLWCICNQPHNNRFMICCDTCEEWYHGKCVNVTKAMGQLMEQQGKEWICVYCKDPSLKRPAAAARRVRKASRTSATDNTSETKTESVQSSPIGSPSSIPGCLVCGKPCRTNSIYCSDPCILKHAKVVEKVEKVVVFERSSGRILSGNNAPTAVNLDKWLQQNPGFEVVRSTSTNKPITTKPLTQSKLKIIKNPASQGGVSLAVQRKGVNVSILQHLPKQQGSTPHKNAEKRSITGIKILNKQAPPQPKVKSIQATPIVRNSQPVPAAPKPKLVQTSLKSPPTPKDKPMPQKTPKSRQAEETPPPKKEENIRDNVQKTLFEQLTNRLKLANDLKLTKEEVNKIATEIELQLYKCFGDTGQKYRNKYRSLIFNIKDIKNQTLWRRICEKSISPYQLVRLSPDDMASQELALWRERENKHQLDMITKSELEQLGRTKQYVFKTHKGEQELEDDRPTDAVENTEVIMALGADGNTSPESSSDVKKDSKDKDKKGSGKHKSNRDRKSSKEKDKNDRKEKKREHRSTSRDRSHRKRSRSKEGNRHSETNRSRSRDRDRHRRSSHKSSRHKKDLSHSTTDKLDKKSKEILEQLVDNKIVPPLEDRLWKHVQQEDITTAPNAESDSDHEPSSTVTIPTPPQTGDNEENNLTSNNDTELKEDKHDDKNKNISQDSYMDEDGSRSPPPRTSDEYFWKGTINMVDVAQISITAHEVSGDCMGLGTELPLCLDVVGRISPDTVWDYIGKMKCSNSKTISLIRLNAINMEEKMPYIALYSYLSSRNRLGVVKSNNKAVKDFYILPLSNQKPIPQALLPLNGPGFEESRPSLLLGIIVRDKRKRPLFNSNMPSVKRAKMEVPPLTVTPTVPTAPTVLPSRSYTPPPASNNVDPRLKPATAVPAKAATVATAKDAAKEDDMDEPYSPEDSDPDTTPAPADTSKSSNHLNSSDLSNLLTGSVKSSSFLDTGISTQTFEPFTNKFDTIPGLDENAPLPASSQELQRKMEELDQCIAIHKAEIDNMSQNISTTTGIGQSTLANIALPSNLQQILDSIKGINPGAPGEGESLQATKKETKSGVSTESELTIPLILPKINARCHTTIGPSAPAAASIDMSNTSSPTIPLNLPKYKSKFSSSASNSPISQHSSASSSNNRTGSDKNTSVLSSLSEEDLIKKAAEMLAESEDLTNKNPDSTAIESTAYSPTSVFKSSIVGQPPTFNSGPIIYTPPPNLVPPSSSSSSSSLTSKSANLDLSQPPIPGLEN